MKLWITSIFWTIAYLCVYILIPDSFFATAVSGFLWIMYSLSAFCLMIVYLNWDKITDELVKNAEKINPKRYPIIFKYFSAASSVALAYFIAESGRPILAGFCILCTIWFYSFRSRSLELPRTEEEV